MLGARLNRFPPRVVVAAALGKDRTTTVPPRWGGETAALAAKKLIRTGC